MRAKLKYEYVYLLAILPGMGAYFLLRTFPWSIDLGTCLSYTLLVFGLVWRQNPQLLMSERAKSGPSIALGHLAFLAVVFAFVRAVLYAKPFLPYWLLAGTDSRPNFGLVCLATLCLLALVDQERRWLLKGRKGEDALLDLSATKSRDEKLRLLE